MRLWQSFKIAVSMYSVLPMPKTDWEQGNMRYVLCFFPVVGVLIAAVLWGWLWLCGWFQFGTLIRSVGCTVIPVLVTGGIHLDGFADTTDALSSRQPAERKLEILKDPNAGAFAVIGLIVLFLMTTAFWSEYRFTAQTFAVLSIGFILSRAWSGLLLVLLKPAKNSGLLYLFSDAAQKQTVKIVLSVIVALCMVLLLSCSCTAGTAVILAVLVTVIYYIRMSKRQFGGITGDLAGYFLVLCECAVLLAVILVQKIS